MHPMKQKTGGHPGEVPFKTPSSLLPKITSAGAALEGATDDSEAWWVGFLAGANGRERAN